VNDKNVPERGDDGGGGPDRVRGLLELLWMTDRLLALVSGRDERDDDEPDRSKEEAP